MNCLRLLPLLLVAACATRSALDESRNYTRLGDHARAFLVLDEMRTQQLAGGGTVAPELEAAHHEARLEFLRWRAQRRIFEEYEDAALADLAELESLAPDYPGAAALRERANRKKALRIARDGDECLAQKDYVGAMANFLESQRVMPTEQAVEGLERVREATAALSARAKEQFLEAVRKLPEFRFIEVQWHSGNAIATAPERDDARLVQDKARRENAMAAMARGKSCESAGQFGAALLEYRLALKLDKDVPGVAEGIAQMEREMKASVLIDRAEVDMRAARFAEAREQLAEARELSVMRHNDIGALELQCRKLEGERAYKAARDLEVLGRKAEALVAFEAVAKDWPEGLLDEKARIDGLRVDLEGAAKAWSEAEAAEAAGDLAKALDLYVESERFYAGWKDGKARIARLREALARQPGSEGAGGEGTPPTGATGPGNGG